MKTITLALLFFVSSAHADEWTRADTYREVAYLAVVAIDWKQTHDIVNHPYNYYTGGYTEQNPFLGKYPAHRDVDRYFLLTSIAHVAISAALPSEWRAPFQYVSIGVELGWVHHNYSIGLRVGF